RIFLLTEQEQTIELPEKADWIITNAGGHGFYRVRYAAELLDALKGSWREQLSAVERFSVINDAWAASMAGLTSLADYLDLTELVRDDNDINVWTAVIGSCHHLHRILDDAQCGYLEERLRRLFGAAVERFGWSVKAGESALESQLRGDLIGTLGTIAGDRVCQQRACELFAQYEKAPESVDANLVPALVAIVAHTGAATDYEKFHQRFKTAQTPQEETRYLFALGNFRGSDLIDRTLDLTINGEVRTQNSPYLMRAILLNKHARQRAWSFMTTHWDEMVRQYPDNSIPRMCEGIVGLVSPQIEAEVRQFFAAHPVKQGAKQMEQHLERLRVAVLCRERWRDLLRA
ncbi:MAG: ERAP1-like C-terminal domain-containing protein, partial [Chloroflexota bacterium]